MITTYMFDMNDTIVDSSVYSKMHRELIRELADNTDYSEDDLNKMMYDIRSESGGLITDNFDLSKKVSAKGIYYDVLEKYTRHTFELKTKEIPKIFKEIKQKGHTLGIVSSSKEKSVEIFLRRFNLLEYVDFIESGDKGTLLFWITLAKKHNLEKENTLMVDDSKLVLEIAKHAGYKVLNIDDIEGFVIE